MTFKEKYQEQEKIVSAALQSFNLADKELAEQGNKIYIDKRDKAYKKWQKEQHALNNLGTYLKNNQHINPDDIIN